MKKLILILIVVPLLINAQSQGITNWWYQGYECCLGLPYGINIDFFNGAPSINYKSRSLSISSCHANISDSSGNMLFYTNGYDICDASDTIMLNGDNISPSNIRINNPEGLFVPQCCLILPKPNNSNLYYIFHNTLDQAANYQNSLHLYYSVIDMNLNNGLGAVTTKNVTLINDNLNPGKIISCKHGNGRDWWVFCMQDNTNLIYKFLITPYGINGPYTQNIGVARGISYGQVKFNQSGTKFSYFNASYTTSGHLELFDFDRCSGFFSNPIMLSIPQSTSFAGGIEFSPNDSLLYVSNCDSVYQFEIYSNNFAQSKNTVAVWDSFYSPYPPFSTALCSVYLHQMAKFTLLLATALSTCM